MVFNKPSVSFIKKIDTKGQWWCDYAVMFEVKNGRNTIREIRSPEDEDYDRFVQLQINGKPVVQSKQPVCSTCSSLLATGYGIENIDCPEFASARECMNSGFVSLTDSFEKIKPLLGLLSDGYYALADTLCFPSDGEGHFFYEIPDEPKYYDAACDGYYRSYDYSIFDSFPLFLYPTQSSLLISNERVEYYAQIMKQEKEPPRALAYHFTGFMSLLLDGHHKACAAASLGKALRCLTIIPADGCTFDPEKIKVGTTYKQANPEMKTIGFSGLETDAEGLKYLDVFGKLHEDENVPPIERYSLTKNRFHYGPVLYPTIRDFAALLNEKDNRAAAFPDLDLDTLLKLTDEETEDTDRYLEAVIHYLSATDQDKAYKLAGAIVRKGNGYMRRLRIRASLLFLLGCRSDETEQLFADYYNEHVDKEHDENWEIANSYWTENKDK